MSTRARTEPKEVTGQVSPDRISALEAEVSQLKIQLLTERENSMATEGVVRDLGRKIIEFVEIHKSTVVELGKLSDHVARHDEAYRARDLGAVFCPYCYPKEGTRS